MLFIAETAPLAEVTVEHSKTYRNLFSWAFIARQVHPALVDVLFNSGHHLNLARLGEAKNDRYQRFHQ